MSKPSGPPSPRPPETTTEASWICSPEATACSRPAIVPRDSPAAESSTVSPPPSRGDASGSCDFARTVAIAGEVAKE